MARIRRLSVFPMILKKEWLFRISVSDYHNIMVLIMNRLHPTLFMIRFFQDEAEASAFIDECAEGKHIDDLN